MTMLIAKYAVTALIVVLVSEVAKRADRLGALIASLPVVTILVMIWLHLENQGNAKIANHAWYTFWYVIPTLPMFLLFPYLLPHLGFWPTLGISVVVTIASFAAFAALVRPFGISLL